MSDVRRLMMNPIETFKDISIDWWKINNPGKNAQINGEKDTYVLYTDSSGYYNGVYNKQGQYASGFTWVSIVYNGSTVSIAAGTPGYYGGELTGNLSNNRWYGVSSSHSPSITPSTTNYYLFYVRPEDLVPLFTE